MRSGVVTRTPPITSQSSRQQVPRAAGQSDDRSGGVRAARRSPAAGARRARRSAGRRCRGSRPPCGRTALSAGSSPARAACGSQRGRVRDVGTHVDARAARAGQSRSASGPEPLAGDAEATASPGGEGTVREIGGSIRAGTSAVDGTSPRCGCGRSDTARGSRAIRCDEPDSTGPSRPNSTGHERPTQRVCEVGELGADGELGGAPEDRVDVGVDRSRRPARAARRRRPLGVGAVAELARGPLDLLEPLLRGARGSGRGRRARRR